MNYQQREKGGEGGEEEGEGERKREVGMQAATNSSLVVHIQVGLEGALIHSYTSLYLFKKL